MTAPDDVSYASAGSIIGGSTSEVIATISQADATPDKSSSLHSRRSSRAAMASAIDMSPEPYLLM